MKHPTCTGRPKWKKHPPKKHPPREMHNAGKVWSGYNYVQKYKCQSCGRTTIVAKPDKPPKPSSKPL